MVADLTITDQRQQYIDFSVTFMSSKFSALVRQVDAQSMATLDDLALKKKANPESFAFGSVISDDIVEQLAHSTKPLGREIYSWLRQNPTGQVNSLAQALDKVAAGGFALLTESTISEWAVGQDCRNFTVLLDVESLMEKQFANALPKGSQYLAPFNQATRELIEDGTIERLRKRYWKNNC